MCCNVRAKRCTITTIISCREKVLQAPRSCLEVGRNREESGVKHLAQGPLYATRTNKDGGVMIEDNFSNVLSARKSLCTHHFILMAPWDPVGV